MSAESTPYLLNHQIEGISQSLPLFLPEIYLSIAFILFILLDFILKPKSPHLFIYLSALIYLGYLGLVLDQFLACSCIMDQDLFLGMLRLDSLGIFLKLIFGFAALLTVGLGAVSQNRYTNRPEYYSLFIVMLLGADLMVMSVNLLMIYLAIELLSITSYILTFFRFDKQSSEGSMKYLLFGAFSSGVMLYGMSFLYGFTGTLDILNPVFISRLAEIDSLIFLMAASFTLSGLLFKISGFPFHFWTPDIYQSAPTAMVAFFSTVPKIAGLLVLLRLFSVLNPVPFVFEASYFHLRDVLIGIAAITLIVGNFSALWQTDMRRLMAYSSISQAGILLIPVLTDSEFALQSWIFYLIIYVFLNFGVFLCIELLAKKIKDPLLKYNLSSYKGLGMKYPFFSVCFLLLLIGLVGLPPMAGFTAKLLVFSSLWQYYEESKSTLLLSLFLVAIFSTVIALFYYLKAPFYLFFRENEIVLSEEEQFSFLEISFLIFLCIPVILFFFKADWLLDLVGLVKF